MKIICTQPRKLAATSLATRVAEEWSAGAIDLKSKEVGLSVGYRVGPLVKARPFTALEYWTEGTLMSKLINETVDMNRVGVIVLDEAHERSITLDITIALLKSRQAQWPHLRVVVTSATLDTGLFSNYLLSCPILSIPGHMFPVVVIYRSLPNNTDNITENVIQVAWEIHTTNSVSDGDILCFLTGQAEVEKAVEKFSALLRGTGIDNACAFALYGKQLPEEQQGVFKCVGHGLRKVVFSTDVAETSITIDGISFVVDSGLTKESVYDARRNVTLLEVRTISKSSADQRKGRAGRTRPGTCYRLYSRDEYDGMRISQVPNHKSGIILKCFRTLPSYFFQVAELLSNSLVLTVASLAAKGIDAANFPWIEKPDAGALVTARRDLELLGAFDDSCDESLRLSPIGFTIDLLQIDPALALLVYRGCERGYGEAAIILAAMFTVASTVFWRGSTDAEKNNAREAHKRLMHSEGDAVTLYYIYTAWQGACVLADTVSANSSEVFADDGDDLEIELTLAALQTCNKLPAVEILRGVSADAEDFNMSDDGQSNVLVGKDDASFVSSVMEDTLDDAVSVNNDSIRAAEAEERDNWRQHLKAQRAAAKRWCKDNFVNGKSMGMAQTKVKEMTHVLKKTALWDARPQATPTVTSASELREFNTELCKLMAGSMYLNLAVRISDRSEYSVVKNDIPTIAFTSPGSALSQLRDQVQQVDWLVFHTLFQSSRPFLNTLAPVKREWIEEFAPQFFEEIQLRLSSVSSKRLTFSITKTLIRSVFGKRYENIRVWENEMGSVGMNCSLQLTTDTGELVVWCSERSSSRVAEFVNHRIEKVRQSEISRVLEDTILGNTRAVFTQGGLTETLLFGPQQYISVIIRDLPPLFTVEELAVLGSAKSQLKVREVIILNDGKSSAGEARNVLGKVVYLSATDAAHSLSSLNGEFVGSNQITVSPCVPSSISSAAVNETSGYLLLSWSNAPSSGDAFLKFDNARTANEALTRLRSIYGGNVRALGSFANQCPPAVTGRPIQLQHKLDLAGNFVVDSMENIGLQYCLRLRGLNASWDEVELERQLPLHAQTKPRIEIKRGPIVHGLQEPIMDVISYMRSLVPDEIDVETIVTLEEKKGKCGLQLWYRSIQHCEVVMQNWKAKP